ncbi:MAG: NIL domain-containing protein [Chloroflexia bacterium]
MIERRVRLTYPPHLLDQPLLYRLIRQFDVQTNILEAHVTSQEGRLTLAVRGEQEQVLQGLRWMEEQGVQVEVLDKEER